MYVVRLTNFGYNIYEGDEFELAMQMLQKSGFESTMHASGELVATYSPITGLKRFNVEW